MTQIDKFGRDLRKLFKQRFKEGKLDIEVFRRIFDKKMVTYQEVDGELCYYLEPGIVDKISDEIKDEIDALWSSSC